MIRPTSYFYRSAKALGIKKPRRFARRMAEKQFDKYLPHGGIRRFEQALRAADRRVVLACRPNPN